MSHEEESRKQILGLIQIRKDSYGSVLVQSAISKRKGKWQNIVTKIVPLHRQEKLDSLKKLDYGDFVIVESLISLEELVEFVQNLPTDTETSFSLGGYEFEIPRGGFQDPYEYDSSEGYLNVGWFFKRFHFSCSRPNYSYGPLISSELPLFADSNQAIQDCLGIEVASSGTYGVLICLPNYSARITEIKVGPTEVSISVETKDTTLNDIIAKCYCQSANKTRQEDVTFSSSQSRFFIGFRPETAYFALVSKSKDEMLDKRRIYSSWRLPKDVVIDIPEFEIKQLIEQGESNTVEFKRQIEGESRQGDVYEFVESVVAFANSKGGVILLGVDNDAQVHGLSEKDDVDRIGKIVRSHCIPEPKYECMKRSIDEKEIIVIKVEEGSDKPYTAWQKGVFIRAGSTDRIAERYELDEVYRLKGGTGFRPIS
ncbi:MAG: ATP-binding protein [Candidatus Bathyarchaeia archaeon]|jgi:hypothetical protein